MIDTDVASLKVEVRYLSEDQKELKEEIKLLRKELHTVATVMSEYQQGKRWLVGMFFGAVALGQLIDYVCRLVKIY